MYGHQDLKLLIHQRHEAALREAQTGRLAKLAQGNQLHRNV
jgi:hypothetical protein